MRGTSSPVDQMRLGPPPEATNPAASAGTPDFVADLVTDPADPPATALFLGFAGEASEQDHTRFYVDPALTAFVDVPDDAVLLQHEVPAAPGSMGGAYVWLRRDSDIVERLRTALGDAARIQAEVWNNGSAAVVESGVPWATPSNGAKSDGVKSDGVKSDGGADGVKSDGVKSDGVKSDGVKSDGVKISSMPTAIQTSGSDDIPLPPGWPTG